MKVRITRVEIWEVVDPLGEKDPVNLDTLQTSITDDILNSQEIMIVSDDGKFLYIPCELVVDVEVVEEKETES